MINLSPIFTQLALRKIAYFSSCTLGSDIYFMKEFVDIMIHIIGEDEVVKLLKADQNKINAELGEKWKKVKRNLLKIDKVIEKTKTAYDVLDDPTFEKKELTYKDFIDRAKKIPLIKQDLYALFVFLINNSSINKFSVPPELFKILEHRNYRAVGEMEKKRVGDQQDKSYPPEPQ